MQIPYPLAVALTIIQGIFWTITYILVIRKSIKDRRYGMPLITVCLNLSWEFIFSFLHPLGGIQLYFNYIGFFLDVVILCVTIKYSYVTLNKKFRKDRVIILVFLCLLACLLVELLVNDLFQKIGSIVIAFSINAIMSFLFIVMLINRKSSKGQSVYIALSKMIGTASISILFYFIFPESYSLHFIFAIILLLDLIYLGLLFKTMQKEGKSPIMQL